MRKILAVALVAFFVVGALVVQAPEAPAAQKVIKYGYLSPPTFAMGRTSQFFKEYIEEKTNGEIKIELYPLGQLGGMRAMFDSVLAGTLDICTVASPLMATAMPEFNVINLPFVVPNNKVISKMLATKEIKEILDGAIKSKGIVPLFICDNGPRGFLNKKRPVRTPKDIKGLRMRVMQGPIYTDTFRALGAQTRTMPFPEVYTALQQGLIDGEDNSLAMAVAMKFVEVEKYWTPLTQTMIVVYVLGSKNMWDGLTDEQRKIFLEARPMMEKVGLDNTDEDDSKAVKIATEKYGVKCEAPLTPEELGAFKEKVKPVLKKYRPIVGEKLFDKWLELAAKYSK